MFQDTMKGLGIAFVLVVMFVAGLIAGTKMTYGEAVEAGVGAYGESGRFSWVRHVDPKVEAPFGGMSYCVVENTGDLGHTVITRWGWGYNVSNVPTTVTLCPDKSKNDCGAPAVQAREKQKE